MFPRTVGARPVTVLALMNVQGIDVSNYQHSSEHPPPDWGAAAAAGVRFAWVLVSDGLWANRFCGDDLNKARSAGIKIGGYHFARPLNDSADTEARWFRANYPADLDLPSALDMEQPNAHQPNWLPTKSANTDWALRFFDVAGGHTKLLYTNGDGATNHLDSHRLVDEGVELWYAHPTSSDDLRGVAAWQTASAVQYTQGVVAGFNGTVDLDVMPEEVLARWTSTRGSRTRHPQEDENVLHIVKGDKAPEWWLTDLVSKRYIPTPHDAEVVVFTTVTSGGRISHNGKNGPKVLPQASVDAIPVRLTMD